MEYLEEPEVQEVATMFQRIVAFLLAYCESRGLVVETEEPRECEDVDAVLS